MFNTKWYTVYWTWNPFYRDLDGKWKFWRPRFRFDILLGTPCPTWWYYDWILYFGYITIFRKSERYLVEGEEWQP